MHENSLSEFPSVNDYDGLGVGAVVDFAHRIKDDRMENSIKGRRIGDNLL